MKKDKETGFLMEEIGSYKINNHIEYVDKIYLYEEDENLFIYLRLTTQEIEEDYKFYGILDLYDVDIFTDKVCDIEEYTEDYNPKWILKIQYSNNFTEIEKLLNEILSIHAAELERIIPLINEEDYAE